MKSKILGLLAVGLLASAQASANLLVDGGFESPITYDGPPFVGSWEGFNGGGGASASNSTVQPRTGTQHLDLSISSTDNTFAGVAQEVAGLSPGTAYTFSGWNLAYTSPLDLGVEIRIEWRNSGSNTEISRTPNLIPVLAASYSVFSLSAIAPVGADLAYVVYAIQTFGPEPTNNGSVFVDDLFFDASPQAVPEPGTLALLGLGLAGLGLSRRRKA